MLYVMAHERVRTPAPEAVVRPAASLPEQAAAGDRRALAAILSDHGPDVVRLCQHLMGPEEGRDAAQEAFERIVQQVPRFDPHRGTFRSWALTVARRVCLDRLRRRKLERAAFVADGESGTATAAAAEPAPERATAARSEAGRIARALDGLSEGMREAVVLFHVHGSSYEEIAATLDVPMGTVMTWLHRGRRRLREAVDRMDGAASPEAPEGTR